MAKPKNGIVSMKRRKKYTQFIILFSHKKEIEFSKIFFQFTRNVNEIEDFESTFKIDTQCIDSTQSKMSQ